MSRRSKLALVPAGFVLALVVVWAWLGGRPSAVPAGPKAEVPPAEAPAGSRSEATQRSALERAAPVEAPAEPAVGAAPPEEFDLDDRSSAGPPPGAGVLEVWVRIGPEPVACLVDISRYQHGIVLAEHLSGPRDFLERRPTDERGVATFQRLEPGDYCARASLPDGAVLEARAAIPEPGSGERIWLLFGTGGIRGRLFAEDGAPLAEQRVVVSAHWLHMRVEATTGWDGAYSVPGLRSGPYFVTVRRSIQGGDPEERQVRVTLAPGEWKTVDFGSARPLSRWSGALLLSDGTRAAGPDRLTLTALERGEESVLEVAADGSFGHSLLPGRHAVRCWVWGGWAELGPVEIGPGEVRLDLRLPGTELAGVVRYVGASEHGDWAAKMCQVWLTSADDPTRGDFARVREDGRYGFRGLSPGKYRMSVYPGRLASAPGGELFVNVPEGRARIELDLDLGDP